MDHSLAIIFFSKDRAMQLHASISSLKKYATFYEWADVFVLYKTDKYSHQYKILKEEFTEISFVRETDLTKQTYEILTKYDAVLFITDDTLFYKDFNLARCVQHLFNHPEVLGFSLRLGYNVRRNHIANGKIERPKAEEWLKVVDNYFRFKWPGRQRDFGYPLEVSSSIYRTQDINLFLKEVKGDPGAIEGYFSGRSHLFRGSKPYLMCYDSSVAFAVPVNIVRDNTRCPAGRKYPFSVEELVALFDQGLRIDISSFSEKIDACHVEIRYRFMK